MKLSELVRWSGKRRQAFRRVAHAIEAAQTFADEDEARANLTAQRDATDHFIAEKQADRAAQYADLKAKFEETRQAFYTEAEPFWQDLDTAAQQFREGSRGRIESYRTAYRARRTALDEGLDKATGIYREFAPYLRNRQWLRSAWARLSFRERIAWILLHTVALFGVLFRFTQVPSASAFLQDPLLLLWGGFWLISLIRWGAAWGLASLLRRRDAVLFEAVRKNYKAFDIARKRDALAASLPTTTFDLSILPPAPTPDDVAPGDDEDVMRDTNRR